MSRDVGQRLILKSQSSSPGAKEEQLTTNGAEHP